MPRRSKRLDESMNDQAMPSQVNSATARSKEMDSGTTGGGARIRKSEEVSVLESNKKCTRTRARMNDAVDASRNDRSVSIKRNAWSFEERCGKLLASNESKLFSRPDRASRGDWFQMESC